MYLGQIELEAQTELLFNRPLHPYQQGLLTAIPTTEPGRLAPTLAGEPPDPLERHAGCLFVPRCFKAQDRCQWEMPEPHAGDWYGDLRY